MKFSDFIKNLQKAMNDLGESLTVDGDPGPKTKAALELFDATVSVTKVGGEVDAPSNHVSPSVTTGQDSDEGTAPWYRRMFSACVVSPGKESMLRSAVGLISRGMPQYREVAKRLGAEDIENFSWILGAIHFKEASCDFKGVLHNGERIIGTGKKTSLVPKGRGPFSTWADAAVDAIGIESTRWVKLLANQGDIGDVLWALERYNGTGYISGAGKAETSPYLWACSNINDGKGKYVADGHFDSGASTGATPGAALILKDLSTAGLFKTNA